MEPKPDTPEKPQPDPAHRKRQAVIAAALNQLFGQWGEGDPDLWDQRTFLLLVALVHERLATSENELPTDELMALAKTLAENRRNMPRPEAASDTDGVPPSLRLRPGRDSGTFAEVVHEIYGTTPPQ